MKIELKTMVKGKRLENGVYETHTMSKRIDMSFIPTGQTFIHIPNDITFIVDPPKGTMEYHTCGSLIIIWGDFEDPMSLEYLVENGWTDHNERE